MIVILNPRFEDKMTLRKAKKYLRELNHNPWHPLYYQSLVFIQKEYPELHTKYITS